MINECEERKKASTKYYHIVYYKENIKEVKNIALSLKEAKVSTKENTKNHAIVELSVSARVLVPHR